MYEIIVLWLSQFQACPFPLGICQEFVILLVMAVGNLSENYCSGVGHLSILL